MQINEYIRFGVGVAVDLEVTDDGQTITCRSRAVFWRPLRRSQWKVPLPGRWLLGDVVVTQSAVTVGGRAPPPSAMPGGQPFDVSFVVTHPLCGETFRFGGRYWPQQYL